MSEIVKPCEVPCPKCGHSDVHRTFRARGSDWQCEEYGKAANRYGYAETWVARSTRDHIDNKCRCCSYRWQTLPLAKPRKALPAPPKENERG